MYAFAQDLRFALRQLRRVPGFTLTVILTLALGIGITTAIFSLVESILLRPLPFNRAERLVLLGDHLGNGAATPVTAREISTYANATSALPESTGRSDFTPATSNSAAMITTRMPMPESGLLDEPISPAM